MRSIVNPIQRRLGRIVAIVLVFSAALAVESARWGSARESAGSERSLRPSRVEPRPARSVPVRLAPASPVAGGFHGPEAAAVLERLSLRHPGSLSIMFHTIRLFGTGVRFECPGASTRPLALEIALDERLSQAFFGPRSSLVQTRSGIRSLVVPRLTGDRGKMPERQAHIDQLLATLAEAGVPTDRLVNASTGTGTVQSLLDESIANFDLGQEIEWSAIAFALYLPPRREWTDRYGRRYTFDDLVAEMMDRPFDRDGLSCEGTHLLYSLGVIYVVDQQQRLLTPVRRRELHDYLRNNLNRALQSQEPDGGWRPGWYRGDRHTSVKRQQTSAPDSRRVLVTGHLLEWMLVLPEDFRPSGDQLRPAIAWLRDAVAHATVDAIRADYCPYSHAAHVLIGPIVEPSVGSLRDGRPARLGRVPGVEPRSTSG